jgi:phosphoserine phosphatase RsbU/P
MHTRELVVQLFDGSQRKVPLQGARVTLGRSSENDLTYPDDPVLSRRHINFDFDGQNWWVEDLNTTNGTLVNGARLAGRHQLSVGDTISAGRLTLNFEIPRERDPDVTFVTDESQHFAAVSRASDPPVRTSEVNGTSRVQALLDAGRELASDRPLKELFPVILDLVISAVGGSRGLIMILEDGKLVPRAMRGSGFRISTAVRNRVMVQKESILILDASRHEILRSSTTIQTQRVKSLMAVPLQTGDRIIGLVYVDSQDEVRLFLHEDLTLMTLMANMAAARIEKAQPGD